MYSSFPSRLRALVKVPGALFIISFSTAFAEDPLPPLKFPDACGVQFKTHNFTPPIFDQAYNLGFRAARRGAASTGAV